MERKENWQERMEEHKLELNGNPSVYCGTYAKYNNGSIYGMWIDLTTFADYEDFIDFCKELHADEHDPELMFQDYEGFPTEWYSESCMDEETFDKIVEYGNLDKDDQEMWDAYIDYCGGDADFSTARDRCMGKWDSEVDFAEDIVDQCYTDSIPQNLIYYFDYEKFARDLFMDGYIFCNGYVFCDR